MRICVYGGPGIGKTTVASSLFAQMSKDGHKVGQVHEYIKLWAVQGRKPKSFDQVYIFGKQLHAEDQWLQGGTKVIVTDYPVLMNVAYAKMYSCPYWQSLKEIALQWEVEHPTFNIFLDRAGIPYHTHGRYETYEQALERDKSIREFLESCHVGYRLFSPSNIAGMLEEFRRHSIEMDAVAVS